MTKRSSKTPLENTPAVNDFQEWLDSSEGQLSIHARDLAFAALEGADVDPKGRKIVWSDGKRLSIEESAERIHAEHPDVPRDQVETHVFGWLESCVPEGYSEAQLGEFDQLTEEWLEAYERASRDAGN